MTTRVPVKWLWRESSRFCSERYSSCAVEGPPPAAAAAPEQPKAAPQAKGKAGATAGSGEESTAGASAAPAANAAAAGATNARRSWSAASCGALLWAFACCAVGAFLGFIFGIPRSLSSDTTRTVNPAHARASEAAREKAAALKAAAVQAAADKDKATGAAAEAGMALERAARELDAAKANAGQGAGSAGRVRELEEAHAHLLEQKARLDKTVLEKTRAAESEAAQARKDEAATGTPGPLAAAAPAHPQNSRGPSTAVNTNLEQISDWLTKIIVGVSLVNSEKIGVAVMEASKEMAHAFDGEPMHSLALAILTYFGVIGLLGGYLLTRLYLQRAFEEIGSSELPWQREG